MSTLLQQSQSFDKHLLTVPIKECGESMVSLTDVASQYAGVQIHYSASVKPFFRVSVAHALYKAAQILGSQGYVLQLFDGYRSVNTQKKKFFQYVYKLQQQHPTMNKYTLYKHANIFIAGIPILAAHTSGAAVDVGIVDAHGKLLDMGTKYYTGSYKSKTVYSGIPKAVLHNRMLLCNVMQNVGFTNYPFEWWHYSLGDVCAAYCSHAPNAIYGPVEYDEGNNKTIYVPRSKWYDYFS